MRLKEFFHKRGIYFFLCLVGCAIFSIYYFFMSRGKILHADDAYQGVYVYNMLTAGNEKIYRLVLSLNTLIAVISYFFTGISLNTPYITYAILYSILIWTTICLSLPQGKKPRYSILIIIIYIMGCINYEGVLIFRAHMDIIIMAYVAFSCLDYLKYANQKKHQWIALLIFACSLVVGRLSIDFLFLIIAFAPILLIEGLRYIKDRHRINLLIIVITILSYFVANGIEWLKVLIFNVMPFHVGEHYNTVIFGNFDTMERNFHELIYALLHMFDAYFLDENMLQSKTLFWFFNCCIILMGLALVIRSIFLFYKEIRYHDAISDDISTAISIGIIGIILSYLLTQIATDYTCWRYCISIFSGIVVLICRYLYQRNFIIAGKTKYMNIICVVLMIFIPLNYQKIPEAKATNEIDDLAIFLQTHGLVSGFCDVWHASYLDAASNGNLHMIALNHGDNGYYQWLVRFENYHADNFNFIIEDTTMPIRQFTSENIIKEFGAPISYLSFDKYLIYIYDYDISTRVVWEDNLSPEQYKLAQAKNYAKTSMEYINTSKNDVGDYYLYKGSEIIGPYILLEAGDYELTIAGENLNQAEIVLPFIDNIEDYCVKTSNKKYYRVSFTVPSEQLLQLFTIKNNESAEIIYYYYSLTR